MIYFVAVALEVMIYYMYHHQTLKIDQSKIWETKFFCIYLPFESKFQPEPPPDRQRDNFVLKASICSILTVSTEGGIGNGGNGVPERNFHHEKRSRRKHSCFLILCGIFISPKFWHQNKVIDISANRLSSETFTNITFITPKWKEK